MDIEADPFWKVIHMDFLNLLRAHEHICYASFYEKGS